MAILLPPRALIQPGHLPRVHRKYADGLKFLALPSAGLVNLVQAQQAGRAVGTLRTSWSLLDAPNGKAWRGTADSASSGVDFGTYAPLPLVGDVSILSFAKYSSVTPSVGMMFDQAHRSGTYQICCLTANAAETGGASAGSLNIMLYQNGILYSVAAAGAIVNELIVGYGGTISGSRAVGTIWRGGKSLAVTTNGTGGTFSATAGTKTNVGYAADFSSSGQAFVGDIYLTAVWARVLPQADMAALTADPWSLFEQQASWKKFFFFDTAVAAGSGNQVVTVPVADIAVAALAPTVSRTAHKTVTVPAATIVVAANAPTVARTANQSVTIPVASIVVAANPPTITRTAHQSVAVPAANIAVAANAPTVTQSGNQIVVVPVAAIAVAVNAPTISRSQHQAVTIPAATIVVAANAPTVSQTAHRFVTVPTADIVVAANPPVISRTGHQTVTVPAAAIVVAANAPTLGQTITGNVDIPLATIVVAAHAPTINRTQSVTVPAGSITVAAHPPGIGQGQSVTIPTASVVVAAHAPTISQTAAQVIHVPRANIVVRDYAPTIVNSGAVVIPIGTGAGVGPLRPRPQLGRIDCTVHTEQVQSVAARAVMVVPAAAKTGQISEVEIAAAQEVSVLTRSDQVHASRIVGTQRITARASSVQHTGSTKAAAEMKMVVKVASEIVDYQVPTYDAPELLTVYRKIA